MKSKFGNYYCFFYMMATVLPQNKDRLYKINGRCYEALTKDK